MITSVTEALQALENVSAGSQIHLEAIRFLTSLDDCYELKNLVDALQSDDFGVRWEAANLLARNGRKSVPVILRALKDPRKVGDQRLRDGVIHIIHNFDEPLLRQELSSLLAAMKGPSADLETMRETYRLLRLFDPKACDEEDSK